MKIFLHYLWAAALVCVGCNADVKTKSVAAAINCEQNALAPECLDQMAQGKIGARVIEGMIRSKELEDGTINAAEVNSTNPLFTFTPPSGVTVAYSAPIVTGSLDPITCNIKRPDCSLVDVPLVNSLIGDPAAPNEDGIYVVCLKLTNKQGISAYLDSYAIILDREAPLIQKIANKSSMIPVTVTPEVYEKNTYTWTDTSKNAYLWEKVSGPGNITFTPVDGASSTISAEKVGIYEIRFSVTDLAGNKNSRTFYLVKSSVNFSATVPDMTVGVSYTIAVTVTDAQGDAVAGYNGEVSFTSTDPQATLAPNYTFKAEDKGTHNFTFAFATPGEQTLTIQNAQESFQQSQYTFTVLPKSFLKHYGKETLGALKYDGSGNETIGYTDTTHPLAGNTLKLGLDGYFYIAGSTDGSLAATNAGGLDCFVAKIATDGTLKKIYQFGTTGVDVCIGASADEFGNIYVGGHTTGSLAGTTGGKADVFMASVDKDTGALRWKVQVNGAAPNTEINTKGAQISRGLIWDGAMNAYMVFDTQDDSFYGDTVGNIDFIKIDKTGTQRLIMELTRSDGYATTGIQTGGGIGLDASSSIYIGGSTTGNFAWNWYYKFADSSTNGGHTKGDRDIIFAKYDSSGVAVNMTDAADDGSRAWVTQIDETKVTTKTDADGDDQINALTVGSDGSVYGVGYTAGKIDGKTAAQGKDAIIVKYPTGGNKGHATWITRLAAGVGGSLTGDETFVAAAMDTSDNIYALGVTTSPLINPVVGGQDLFVAKFDKDGSQLWVHQLSGAFFGNAGIAAAVESGGMIYVDGGGNIFVFGTTTGTVGETNAGGSDLFMLKLNPGDGSF